MRRNSVFIIACIFAVMITGCRLKSDTSEQGKTATKSNQESDLLLDGLYKGAYKPGYYEKYFEDEFSEYRTDVDDISKWKDADGNWCYPKDFKLVCTPSADEAMAGQQFPKELLSSMDTAELYEFALNAPGDMSITLYDDCLMALSTYRTIYNFMDELMGRDDFPAVVHDRYKSYTKEEVASMTHDDYHGISLESEFKKQNQFQLTEALERFYAGELEVQDYGLDKNLYD